jgi:hypothetical protein
MPSGLVITPSPSLAAATATKSPLPYVTETHWFVSAAEAREVHVLPLELVITAFARPLDETATKSPLPYVTEDHWLSEAEIPEVHVEASAIADAEFGNMKITVSSARRPILAVVTFIFIFEAILRFSVLAHTQSLCVERCHGSRDT